MLKTIVSTATSPYHGAKPVSPRVKQKQTSSTVTPQIDGGQIFPTIVELLKQAQDNIKIEMYLLDNRKLNPRYPGAVDSPGYKEQQQIIDLLVEAAKKGVRVQVILDMSRNQRGDKHNEKVAQYLSSQGVEVLAYPTEAVNIDHVKLLIVDKNYALIGGMNWSNQSPAHHDADVLIEGPAVNSLEKAFVKDWLFSDNQKIRPIKEITNEEKYVSVLTTDPSATESSETIKEAILDNINAAKESIYAELFCLTHRKIVDALIEAKERGVKVKIILDPTMQYANKYAFRKLKQAGVDVKWYKVNTEKKQRLHSKWATFDAQKLIIGSANWSNNGLNSKFVEDDSLVPIRILSFENPEDYKTNHEMDVEIRMKEPCSAFIEQFLYDWEHKTIDKIPKDFPSYDEIPLSYL